MTSRWPAALAVLLLLAGLLVPFSAASAAPARIPAGPAGGGTARAAGTPRVPEDRPRQPPPVPSGGYGWPLAGAHPVTRPFLPPPQPWLPGHRGVDLGAVPGPQVLAAGAGLVAFAGQVAGTGVVSVDHGAGLRTTYEPVTPLVRAGQGVRAGQPIGLLLPGHPGCPVAACLHWGLRRGQIYLDPLALLGLGSVRLLPLGDPASASAPPGSAAW